MYGLIPVTNNIDMRGNYLVVIILAYLVNMSCKSPLSSDRVNDFNKDWQFVKDIDSVVNPDLFLKTYKDINWKNISLPHTANIEPLVTSQKQWQGTCFYRKFFKISARNKGKQITLKFGAAMHEACVYLNGNLIYKHVGGYLPFIVDITDQIKFGEENCILVKLNNQDNPVIPPGKPIKELDFNYYSGLYRDVTLIIKDKLQISDAVAINRTAGGGILVSYEDVTESSSSINIKTDIQNYYSEACKATVKFILQDSLHQTLATSETNPINIKAGGNEEIAKKITLSNPKLWSPDNPYLYTLTIQLLQDGKEVDAETLKIGIRSFTISHAKGLVLNGKHLRIRGTNRHQEYPYIGYALSDNAQFRDAWKIKQAGFNFVRCSHYPQSPAFLDACDELGILVMNSIPGWQFFGNEEFQKNSLQDIKDLIHRDRNHPSIILWEASLNETGMSIDYMQAANSIVHEELPFEDVNTCGWMDTIFNVFIPARQHAKAPDYWKKYNKAKPLLIAEYGDWEYYAQNAGFNQTEFKDLQVEERTSRQLRAYGQKRLAQQALNFQEAHNDNLGGNLIGDANWLMFDYNRGYSPDIEASGIMDITRLPKFSFYFYQSQAEVDITSQSQFSKPMIFISNYWSDSTYKTVKIYSNCEEIELYLNNKLIARQLPDTDKYSENLLHPPFTFCVPRFQKGKLGAIGFIGGEKVAYAERISPEKPAKIELSLDYSGKALQARCNDIVFVYASIVDINGTVVPDATDLVNFNVEGPGELIGQNPVNAEAGIASILLRAGDIPGKIVIKASCSDLNEGKLTINTK